MVVWRQENDCAACHHGPMYVWSTRLALQRGYAVDERQLQEYVAWMLDDPTSRVFPAESTVAPTASSPSAADRMTTAMMGRRNLSQPTLYMAHALNALPADDPRVAAGWRKLADHWSAAQMDDGSLAGRVGRPPIFNSPQILTRFAATALADRRAVGVFDDELPQRLADYLQREPVDDTHQGLVLRLLSAVQVDDPQRPALLGELLALQRADGGWSQSADRPSDAFATGQTLYVLYRAGVPVDDRAVLRGLQYLAASQNDDGTWLMTSRPDPETGRPADNLNPITYAAAAWSVIGMASYAAAE
jgi:hypothetical protein